MLIVQSSSWAVLTTVIVEQGSLGNAILALTRDTPRESVLASEIVLIQDVLHSTTIYFILNRSKVLRKK